MPAGVTNRARHGASGSAASSASASSRAITADPIGVFRAGGTRPNTPLQRNARMGRHVSSTKLDWRT